MSLPFPSPTVQYPSRAEVLLGYLAYFRSALVAKLDGLPPAELRASRLPSGWTPLQLLKHLAFVERRWLVWGFEGEAVAEPWGDQQDGCWFVAPSETVEHLLASLRQQAERTRAVVLAHELDEVGQPGERWDGAEPATLERVLLHLVQEYARHVGHLDIVRELVDGTVGE
ncbi:DinB family protein [Geodermatophilus sp. DF01-2]|uniref:DinB family protein n=1 Tax=Geodermatophilus sp. DF01-2 TaxID=2559610 RepID=UPI001073E884|nr:DinB family protein [Geodermatophilus sp. DF01_2]TFV55541.1 DinB family protein [Geodermatophilus sp. DF01_2]